MWILNFKNSFDDFGAFEIIFGLEFLDEVTHTLEFENKQKKTRWGLIAKAPLMGLCACGW